MNVGKSSSYRGLSYEDGMSILNEGTKNRHIHVLAYDASNIGGEIYDLDVESGLEDILDKLGYNRELVYSEDSMRVWFGIYTEKPQELCDELTREIRNNEYIAGIRFSINRQTLDI